MESLSRHYNARRVLVTGGASFIGSALVESLVQNGADVRVVDNLSSGSIANLNNVRNDIEFVKADLRLGDVAASAARGRELVFHLAASHGGRGYIDTHPVECTSNMALDHIVFSAAAASGAGRIVFASSACVYPTTLQTEREHGYLLKESDAGFGAPGRAFPDGEYGWAKLMGELQLAAFHRQHGIDGISCRIFTAYGERENETHAVIALLAKALARLDPFPVWGDGTQTRNFTYVADIVQGLLLAGARLNGSQVVNLGMDRHVTINELMTEIFQQLDWQPAMIDHRPDKPVGVRSRASDNARVRELLNWSPATGLAEGVAKTLSWYRTVATPERLSQLETRLMQREP